MIAWSLVSFSALLLALAMRGSLNIGVRHVLPLMPALAVLAGRSTALVLQHVSARSWSSGAATIATAAHVSGMAWAFPDYLSDFNLLVGGRSGGEKISIVGEEWSQDLIRLGRELSARGVRTLYFDGDNATVGPELARFGVKVRRLGCPKRLPSAGHAAVSARNLARRGPRCYPWTSSTPPAFEIPGHIFVYRSVPASDVMSRRAVPERSDAPALAR
jgi:hypothetical protein